MKCLLEMRDAYTDKKHKHHKIGKLFQDLSQEEKEVFRVSYRIFRSLHDYISHETADRFLEKIDKGYECWRYFLREDKEPPTTHPGAMLEIWSALCGILNARVFTNHGLYSVELRIKHKLFQCGLEEAWKEHISTGIDRCEIDEINRWMQKSHTNVALNAFADLFFYHAESGLETIEVLPSTREILNTMVGILSNKWVDNDFAHFLCRAQAGDIVWNPDKKLSERISRAEEIKIKVIESDRSDFDVSLLGPSVKVDFVESVPDYIEDFIFESRVEAQRVDEDWSFEAEEKRARKEAQVRMAEVEEYEGGSECEGYGCNINGLELVLVLYDSKEWIVYRYYNEDVKGVPYFRQRVHGTYRSIREAIRAIEHWRRTKKKEIETLRQMVWNRRGKKRGSARRFGEE